MTSRRGTGTLRIVIAVFLAIVAIVLALRILVFTMKVGIIVAAGIGIYLLLRDPSGEGS